MKVIILIICLFLVTGCKRDLYELPKDLTFNLNDNIYDVFTDVKVDELFTNKDIKFTNEYLKTDVIGEHTYTLEFYYKDKNYKIDLKYNVIDNVAPVIISYYGSAKTYSFQEIYPCDDAVYADNYDTLPTCYIDGEYDITVPGVYNLEYVVSDQSKNETRKKLKLTVTDPNNKGNSNSNNNNSTSTKKPSVVKDMKYVTNKYKNDSTMIGIDVSRWQGDIDYEKVKADGVEFVMMRIGVNSAAKGDTSIDSFYKKNIENAKKAGLKVGVYFYSSATTTKRAYEHAMWVVDTLDGLELDFPIAYDWENWEYFMEYEINLHTFNECFHIFAKTLEGFGYDVMLYSSKFYLENIWTNKYNHPVWLAHYTSDTNYKGDYIMWQFTSSGKVDGVKGDVDINVYYKEKN